MTLNNTMSENNNPEYLDNNDPEKNWDFYRQDHGGMVTENNGIADRLLTNNDLYRSMKGDWSRTAWNKGNNIKVTTGRQDGKFYITREQMNTEEVKQRVKNYRHAAEAGIPDPLAPIGDDGNLTYKWMELPTVISIRISDQYFDGIPWMALKNDRTLKAQFYRVVEQEYPEYVCYPGGKLPIPINVQYPTKKGEKRYFKGN
jgi:hypothetical protein